MVGRAVVRNLLSVSTSNDLTPPEALIFVFWKLIVVVNEAL
jgi:hypothetical protein